MEPFLAVRFAKIIVTIHNALMLLQYSTFSPTLNTTVSDTSDVVVGCSAAAAAAAAAASAISSGCTTTACNFRGGYSAIVLARQTRSTLPKVARISGLSFATASESDTGAFGGLLLPAMSVSPMHCAVLSGSPPLSANSGQCPASNAALINVRLPHRGAGTFGGSAPTTGTRLKSNNVIGGQACPDDAPTTAACASIACMAACASGPVLAATAFHAESRTPAGTDPAIAGATTLGSIGRCLPRLALTTGLPAFPLQHCGHDASLPTFSRT
mmetsp:Transcript_18184/g.49894  ORF Transcript_18184/g.49894 Transcript_18184/m.49894 type:complete len:270 (-) Transcript_18184:12-821(-)